MSCTICKVIGNNIIFRFCIALLQVLAQDVKIFEWSNQIEQSGNQKNLNVLAIKVRQLTSASNQNKKKNLAIWRLNSEQTVLFGINVSELSQFSYQGIGLKLAIRWNYWTALFVLLSIDLGSWGLNFKSIFVIFVDVCHFFGQIWSNFGSFLPLF